MRLIFYPAEPNLQFIFRVAILAGAANGLHACLHAFKARGVQRCGGFGKPVCLGQKIIPIGPDLWLCFRFGVGALRLKGCGNLARYVAKAALAASAAAAV